MWWEEAAREEARVGEYDGPDIEPTAYDVAIDEAHSKPGGRRQSWPTEPLPDSHWPDEPPF
jgi:hypothetical protein